MILRERSETIMQLFTFGFVYDLGEGEQDVEEVDVRAETEVRAKEIALKIAKTELEPGWVRVERMSPGGSAGTVQVFGS